ncbi:MAG: hypothetical protein K2F73_04435 [Ruminococcus sp.]|nr:hypothetical protein [Ruminococcus sp.]
MEIRIIGEKSEIEKTYKKLSEIFPNAIKSCLYTARSGGYRCYIITDPETIEPSQHK